MFLICYKATMNNKRKNYNTTLDIELMKKIKILAIEQDVKINVLLEEAMTDLLKKYSDSSTPTKKKKSWYPVSVAILLIFF